MTEVTSEIRVRIRHIRAARICWGGACEFFAKHGTCSPREFARNGIPVSTLQEIGDPIALRAAAKAIEESENGG